MTREIPGYPRRHPSRPDREHHSPDAFEVLHEHDDRIVGVERRLGALEDYAQEGKLADSKIICKLERIEATDRHATAKLIGAAITSIVLTVGGILGGTAAIRPSVPVTQPGPTRSALDVKLDVCRSMQPNTTARTECMVRVASEPEQ